MRRPSHSTLFPYTTLFRSTLGAILGLVTLLAAQVAAFTPALPTSAANAPAPRAHGPGAPAISTTFVISQFEVAGATRSEEHTSELQSHVNLVCRLLLEKKK